MSIPERYLAILRDPSVVLDADSEALADVRKWVEQQGTQVAEPMVLGPCLRDGDPGDWWKEQHTYCTGSHHFGPYQVVLCSCACHVPPIRGGETE